MSHQHIKKAILKGRRFDDFDKEINNILDYMIQWSEKYGIFLVGCDLSIIEVEDVGKILSQKHPGIYRYLRTTERLDGKHFTNQDEGVVQFRDRKMGEMTVEYVGKTTKPLVTIMGAVHMRPESPIHQILQASNIGYICVDQTYRRNFANYLV